MTSPIHLSRRQGLAGAAALGGLLARPAYLRAQSNVTEIAVQYQSPVFFKTLMEDIARAFEAKHPNIKISYRIPEAGYGPLLQRTLRDAVTGSLADIVFNGINLQRALVDRNLPVDLAPYLAQDPEVKELGYVPAALGVGHVGGRQVGIPFGMSRPVFYYNGDLVKAAGGNPDRLPTTWDEMIELAAAIHAPARNVIGMFYRWNAAGDWGWQALVRSHGGSFVDDSGTKVRFTEAPGREATRLLQRLVETAQMPDIGDDVMYQAMFSGRMGMVHTSSAELGRFVRETNGRFRLLGAALPIAAKDGTLPVGGQVAVMLATDAAKRAAAWEFIKFATGPVGATMMVKAAGYMPATSIPAQREDMLAPLYRDNPLQMLGIAHPEVLTGWYEYPGANALRIVDTIIDHLHPVVAKTSSADAAIDKMGVAVQALLPK